MENFTLLFISAFAILLVGCTSINTNVAMFGTEYYREGITSSENYQELKEYLLNNDIKLYPIVFVSNSPSGALGRIPANGTVLSLVSKDNIKWLQDSMNTLINSELQGVVLNKYDADALILTYCGDYTHATIGENGNMGSMEFSYFLSKMSDKQRKKMFNSPMQSDCAIDLFLGDVFYKNKIRVTSEAANAKISITLKDKNKLITNEDRIALVLNDMASQAMAALLTDGELLKALKAH